MDRRVRAGLVLVAVALGALPLAVGAGPAGAVTASVSTVEEFWDAWVDSAVTQIDVGNDIDLVTYNNTTMDYSTCEEGGGYYPERNSGDVVVDGRGFTLTMLCTPNAVLYVAGTFDLTVRNVTLTHDGAPNPTAFGNGIASEGGLVKVESSTITGNWTQLAGCGEPVDVGLENLCAPVGGGIAALGDVQVTNSTISNNRAPGVGGGIYAGGTVAMSGSVVADNVATDSDTGLNLGGGVAANGGAVIDGVEFRDNFVGCEAECGAIGGGLAANDAQVTSSVFTGNVAGCEEFCTNIGGGVYATGTLTVVGTRFAENQAACENSCDAQGGGIWVAGFDLTTLEATAWSNDVSAAEVEPGPVTVTDSTFVRNVANVDEGGGDCFCEGGGMLVFSATEVRITGSTFDENDARFEGAAIAAGAGLQDREAPPLYLTNSTVTRNTSGGGAIASEGSVTLAYDTITDNVIIPVEVSDFSAATSLGASDVRVADHEYGAALGLNGVLTVFGTVVTGSQGGPNCLVVTSTTSAGWNVSDDTSCGFTNAAQGDVEQSGFDPQLGALAENGGPTRTLLPAKSSPLVDAIPVAACQTGPAAGVTDDQRGVTRPQMLGCDIGSVEVEAPPPPAVEPTFTG